MKKLQIGKISYVPRLVASAMSQSVSSAYLIKIATENMVDSVVSKLDNACENIQEAADAAASNTCATENNAFTSASFANVVSNSLSKVTKMNSNVVLNSGKSLPIDFDSRVIIGPKDSEISKFANSVDTKNKLLEVIQPAHLGLKVKRMYISSNNSVTISGDPRNADYLRNCASLDEAGLEVKTTMKQNPRVIVYDIPMSILAMKL